MSDGGVLCMNVWGGTLFSKFLLYDEERLTRIVNFLVDMAQRRNNLVICLQEVFTVDLAADISRRMSRTHYGVYDRKGELAPVGVLTVLFGLCVIPGIVAGSLAATEVEGWVIGMCTALAAVLVWWGVRKTMALAAVFGRVGGGLMTLVPIPPKSARSPKTHVGIPFYIRSQCMPLPTASDRKLADWCKVRAMLHVDPNEFNPAAVSTLNVHMALVLHDAGKLTWTHQMNAVSNYVERNELALDCVVGDFNVETRSYNSLPSHFNDDNDPSEEPTWVLTGENANPYAKESGTFPFTNKRIDHVFVNTKTHMWRPGVVVGMHQNLSDHYGILRALHTSTVGAGLSFGSE